jgi:hypothetical protein
MRALGDRERRGEGALPKCRTRCLCLLVRSPFRVEFNQCAQGFPMRTQSVLRNIRATDVTTIE